MRHLSTDDLALHYYAEDRERTATARHLQSCSLCASAYEEMTRVLDSITAPAAPEAGDEFPLEICRHVRSRLAQSDPRPQWIGALDRDVVPTGGRLAALAWLVPLLYPFSLVAMFRGAQLARAHVVAIPVVFLALIWALAGPLVALFVLKNTRADRIGRVGHRLVVYGALVATISPALYNLTARIAAGLPSWYLATALVAAAAVLPLSESTVRTEQLRRVHRFSALIIVVFVVAHLSNHLFAIVSISAHTTVLEVLRAVYRQKVVEMFLIGAIVVQLGTGGALVWHAHLRRPSMAISLQALSGLYLAVFFLAHVSAVLLARPGEDTNFVWAAGRVGLLASAQGAASLPYYLLGAAAVFVHVGYPARVKALAFMSELSVRRLSYAAMACAGLVVLTLGLALCGIHLVDDAVSREVAWLLR